MARFKYTGGDQRPDLYGVLEPGDVLELASKPDWGDWEQTSDETARQPTPQPAIEPDPDPASAPAADTRTRPKPASADDTAKEA